MKIEFLLISLLVILSISVLENAYAEIIFSKDIGDGLSQEECAQRHDLFGIYYEPIMDLAKLKIETHPVFLELTENKEYRIISTGLRSSPFSENCNMDLPSFGIHYAIDMTDSYYTRIYVDVARVSYEVHEISTRFIDDSWEEVPNSEPLPFHITNWDLVHILGEYHRAESPIPSQIFKIPYIAVNGKIEHIETTPGGVIANVESDDWAIFAVKIPRNYPYTDHDDSIHPGHGPEVFAFVDGPEEVYSHVTKTDCFYDVWMRISGNNVLGVKHHD